MRDEEETVFFEVLADEAIWLRYASAAIASGESPAAAAGVADTALALHHARWAHPPPDDTPPAPRVV